MSQANEIIHGDCLAILKTFEDNCVDLVFTSPPYEDSRTYGIDFKLKGRPWVDWALVRFVECLRVSRGLVAWVVEGKTKQFRYTATPILLMADLHRAGVHLRKPPVFHRVGIPGSGGPDWLRNDYEFIICATSGGKLPWSDNTAMGHPPKWAPGGDMSYRQSNGARVNQRGGHDKHKKGSRKKDGGFEKAGRPSHIFTTIKQGQEYIPPKNANPGNVIHCKVGGGLMGSKLAHENEAPFPEKLAEFFIRSFCPKDGIVLDPFSGSGTTCAVAEKTGRKWIGIDIRETQIKLTTKRIAEAKNQTKELF